MGRFYVDIFMVAMQVCSVDNIFAALFCLLNEIILNCPEIHQH